MQRTTSNRYVTLPGVSFVTIQQRGHIHMVTSLFINRRDCLGSCIRDQVDHHSINSLAKCFQSSENDHVLADSLRSERWFFD